MLTDTIADLLTRIRNASSARRKDLTVKSSRLTKAIANVLMQKGFIEDVQEVTFTKMPELKIVLKTDRDPLNLKRISKPGQRIYVGSSDIKRVRNGFGIGIISTSHGVMTDKEARHKKLGGEYLCEVY